MRATRGTISSFLIAAATLRVAAAAPVELANESIAVELYGDRPAVKSYLHKATGEKFGGAGENGTLLINGQPIPWNQFEIKTTPLDVAEKEAGKGTNYHLVLPDQALSFDMAFVLGDEELVFYLRNIQDPQGKLKTIGWQDLPLLVCADPEYRYWRLTTSGPDAGGKMWMGDRGGQLQSSDAEPAPVPLVYGTLYRPDQRCVFVASNYPLFPFTQQILPGHRCALALNTYQFRVRNTTMPALQAQIVFLADQNHDGQADLSDYRLWVNRQLPDGDSLYRTAISYKIFLDLPASGVLTTLKQAQEMIEAIHQVTDGLPQLPYLVGWQYQGHDTGYPAMDKVNEHLGGAAALRELFRRCGESLNTTLSYHQNIDDCYKENPGYDSTFCSPNGICHTRDVETGAIFRRLEAMLAAIPVAHSLHFDNLRITNCHTQKGWEQFGVLEELVCGLEPIMQWLKARGITVTTEGQNGMPCDVSLVVNGLWHYDMPPNAFQIWHRKVMGGGYGTRAGTPTRWEFGTVEGVHQDFSYLPFDRESLGAERWNKDFSWFNGPGGLTVSFAKDWPEMITRIYEGTLLYHFFLERVMTKWEEVPGGTHIEYGNKEVIVENANNHLKVTWGSVLVAVDDERFIPRGDAIYAYSRAGSERSWVLPEKFRGKELCVFTLNKAGRGQAPAYKVEGNRIQLKLDPRTPVKIMLGK